MASFSTRARPALLALALCAVLSAGACAKKPPATPATIGRLPAIEQLRQDLASITHQPGVDQGVWGIVVQSLDRGERLFEINPRTLLVPASAAKLITVAAAAEAVGWDYRFQTTVSTSGPVLDVPAGTQSDPGILRGDLVVTGTGDPTIGGRAGDDLAAWISAIKAFGIRRIEGRIVGDDDLIEEPRPSLGWTWDDLGYPTGVIFGALNFAENRMTVTIAPGDMPGAPARLTVDPFAADRPLINRTLTGAIGSTQQLWPEQRPGEPALTIAGSIPPGASPARLIVSAGNPTLWFASALRSRLIAEGIPVTGSAVDVDDLDAPLNRSALASIYVQRSKSLAEIATPLLKDSINLYAEAVMRLNAGATVPATNDAALEGLRQRVAGWGMAASGQQLVDGSGLSRRDVINADALATVLRRMHDRSDTSPWMSALPMAGVDGTLETRMRGTPAERNVRAKTGTMSNVRSLAGYVTTRDGERLAFAVLLNNFEGTGAQATQAVDAIAVRLASFAR